MGEVIADVAGFLFCLVSFCVAYVFLFLIHYVNLYKIFSISQS